MKSYGGAPAHLETPHSHRQAVEIVHELTTILMTECPIDDAMRAFAFWVCRAHAQGRKINSLAFIAERLCHLAVAGDETWLYEIPHQISDQDFAPALQLAIEAANTLEDFGIHVSAAALASTQGTEALARMLRRYGYNAVVSSINHVTSNLINHHTNGESQTVVGWSWFEQFVIDPKAARREKSAA